MKEKDYKKFMDIYTLFHHVICSQMNFSPDRVKSFRFFDKDILVESIITVLGERDEYCTLDLLIESITDHTKEKVTGLISKEIRLFTWLLNQKDIKKCIVEIEKIIIESI
jgi:hypothetical protein